MMQDLLPTVHAVGDAPVKRPAHLLVLSAPDDLALHARVEQLTHALQNDPDVPLADFCLAANLADPAAALRLAIQVHSVEQLLDELNTLLQRGATAHHSDSAAAQPVLLFTGQGGQYTDMGRQLYATQPVFRAALDRCQDVLLAHLDAPLLDLIYPQEGSESRVDETWLTQPALFAVEYALAQMWLAWGLQPAALMGHSIGEYAAACLAGAYSLEDALLLVAARGRLMQALPRLGTMVVARAPLHQIDDLLAGHDGSVSVAALNGPTNTVLSGHRTVLEAIVRQLWARGCATNDIAVSHAFHSPLMEPMLAPFEQIARKVSYHPIRIPLVSNVTGQLLEPGTVLDAAYWREHISAPVRFSEGMTTLAACGYSTFLEVGPQPVLLSMGKQVLATHTNLAWLPSLKRGQDDWRMLLKSLAQLYLSGAWIDWRGFEQGYVHRAQS